MPESFGFHLAPSALNQMSFSEVPYGFSFYPEALCGSLFYLTYLIYHIFINLSTFFAKFLNKLLTLSLFIKCFYSVEKFSFTFALWEAVGFFNSSQQSFKTFMLRFCNLSVTYQHITHPLQQQQQQIIYYIIYKYFLYS